MHSNVEGLIAAFPACCSSSKVAAENGKRFEIVSNEEFTKIRIDGCLINDPNAEKCDYGMFRHLNSDFYFIELKGKAIQKAFDQIVTTIDYFNKNLVLIPKEKRIGIIISSKVPGGTDVNNLKQQFAKKYGKVLEIKSKELKCPPK